MPINGDIYVLGSDILSHRIFKTVVLPVSGSYFLIRPAGPQGLICSFQATSCKVPRIQAAPTDQRRQSSTLPKSGSLSPDRALSPTVNLVAALQFRGGVKSRQCGLTNTVTGLGVVTAPPLPELNGAATTPFIISVRLSGPNDVIVSGTNILT
jgi:hypothetical protein